MATPPRVSLDAQPGLRGRPRRRISNCRRHAIVFQTTSQGDNHDGVDPIRRRLRHNRHRGGAAGGGAVGREFLQEPRDGSMISLFPETIAYVQLMDPAQGRWDVTKMNYIGSFASVNTTFMVHKGSKIAAADDLYKG